MEFSFSEFYGNCPDVEFSGGIMYPVDYDRVSDNLPHEDTGELYEEATGDAFIVRKLYENGWLALVIAVPKKKYERKGH